GDLLLNGINIKPNLTSLRISHFLKHHVAIKPLSRGFNNKLLPALHRKGFLPHRSYTLCSLDTTQSRYLGNRHKVTHLRRVINIPMILDRLKMLGVGGVAQGLLNHGLKLAPALRYGLTCRLPRNISLCLEASGNKHTVILGSSSNRRHLFLEVAHT